MVPSSASLASDTPTVDDQSVAGHKGSIIGGQKQDGVGDLINGTNST